MTDSDVNKVPLVHKTSFPLKSSLYRDAYKEIVQYTEALDVSPFLIMPASH